MNTDGTSMKTPFAEEKFPAFMSKSMRSKSFIGHTGGEVGLHDKVVGNPQGQELPLFCFFTDKIKTLAAPAEVLQRLSYIPSWMGEGKFEQLEDCLFELGTFLRLLQTDLFVLGLKLGDAGEECFALADQAAILKGVVRKALAYFHEAAKAVEPPFQPRGNDSSESVDESQDDCGANRDGDSFNDVGPADFSEHGKKCTR